MREVARLVYEHPVRLARLMGYDKLVEGLHDGWIREIAFGRGDMTLQGHRGSYKTTCLEVALWLTIITQPGVTVGFLRKASDDVASVMESVQRMLAHPVTSELCEAVYGRTLTITEASSTSVSTDLCCNVSGEPQLSGYGIGGSLTGKHYDTICTDDIVTVRDRFSRAEREATKRAYRELQNVKNRGGRIVNTGTPWHQDDAFTLMPEPERWPVDKTGLISDEEREALKRSMTRGLYAANYELKHVADDDALFKTEPQTFSDPSMLYDGVAHIDAAYGGEDGTAMTIIRWHGPKAYVHGLLWPETHVDKVLDRIKAVHAEYRVGTVHMERNADKGYLAEKLRGMGLPVSTYQERMNKYLKISTHALGAWPDVLRYEDGSDASADYWDEVMGYAEGAPHDDAPDSLASAIRLNATKTKVHLFKGGI